MAFPMSPKKALAVAFTFAALLFLSEPLWADPIVVEQTSFGMVESRYLYKMLAIVVLAALAVEYFLLQFLLSRFRIPRPLLRRQFLLANVISVPITQFLGISLGPLAEVFPIVFETLWYRRKLRPRVKSRPLLCRTAAANLAGFAIGALIMYAICAHYGISYFSPIQYITNLDDDLIRWVLRLVDHIG